MFTLQGLWKVTGYAMAALILVVVSACSSTAAVTPTAAIAAQPPTVPPSPPTAVPPTETALPPTATATAAPTATAVPPTPTAVPPLAATGSSFNAWCIPETAAVSTDEAAKPWAMPAKARAIAMVAAKGTLYYNAQSCVFELAFNQAVPKGTQLEFYDTLAKVTKPWLTVDMAAAPDNLDVAYAVVTHGMVIKPDLWSVLYTVVVRTTDGQEQFKQDLRFMRSWQAPRCWNGTMPNPTTLECPKTAWGDIHPSDPGYGLYSKYGPPPSQ